MAITYKFNEKMVHKNYEKCTEYAFGMDLYDIAGYKVVIKDQSFYLYDKETDVKLSFCSSTHTLKYPEAVMADIKKRSRDKGYEMGKNALRKSINTLLNPE